MAYEFYDILGVDRSASAEEIKKAYRKKAMELHPDRHGGDKTKEAEFKKINEAYGVLSDPQKKAGYDQMGGRADFGQGFGGGSPFGEGFDFGDIFETFFNGGFNGGGGRSRKEVGEDIEIEISATFEEIVLGGKKEVSFDKFEICPDCHGSGGATPEDVVTCTDCGGTGRVRARTQTIFGTMEQVVACPKCHGSGKSIKHACKTCDGKRYKKTRTTKTIDIPAGIEDGMTIKIRGEGHGGRDGNGDLYVHFSAPESEKGLERDGNTLHFIVRLSPAEMALGCEKEIDIPVLGKRKITVKAGSQHGEKIVFRKEGLPSIPGGHKGELIIFLVVQIPEKLSHKEKELYSGLLEEEASGKSGLFGKLF